MFNNQKGFTLIELMVVVVIIGILAAIALPNFLSMQDRAKESEVKANVHTLQLSVEDFKTQSNGIKPVGAGSLAAGVTAPNLTAGYPTTMKNAFGGGVAAVGANGGTTTVQPSVTLNTAAAGAGGVPAWAATARGQVIYISVDQVTPYGIVGEGKATHVALTTEGQ